MLQLIYIENTVIDRTYFSFLQQQHFPDLDVRIYDCPDSVLDDLRDSNRNELPSVIITDINMPTMSGFDLVEELEEVYEGNTFPRLFLTTAHRTKRDIQRVKELPRVIDILDKPITAEMLGAILSQGVLCS